MNCANHSHIPAKRKCFYCKKPICSVCQMRSSGHIFCSDQCHEKHLKENARSKKSSKSQKEALIPGTPQVDSAYHGETQEHSIKNINFETFDAIQAVIESTDKDLKNYLKDLELIFESSNLQSMEGMKRFLEGKMDAFETSLSAFKRAIQDSAGELVIFSENIQKGQNFTYESLEKIKSLIKDSSGGFDEKLSSIEERISGEMPKGFQKLFDALDNFSYSIDSGIENIKSLISNQINTIDSGISGLKENFSTDLEQKVTDLKQGILSKIDGISAAIDQGKDAEKELLEKTEDKIKSFLNVERKSIEDLFSENNRKFTLNLNANKEKVSQSVSKNSADIKDFLDYQKNELVRSVSKLQDSLNLAFKNAEGKLGATGSDINKKLSDSLKENAHALNEDLGSFEEGIQHLLDAQRKSIEEFLNNSESDHKLLLEGFESRVDEMFSLQDSSFDKTLKIQTDDIEAKLSDNSEIIRSHLSSFQTDSRDKMDFVSKSISDMLFETKESVKEAISASAVNVDKSIDVKQASLQNFLNDSFSHEKDFLKAQLSHNQNKLNESISGLVSQVQSISTQNLLNSENSFKAKVCEIENTVNSMINDVQERLTLTSKKLEEFNKSSINEFISKLLSSQEFFTQQLKSHLDKRESILGDKMAALVVTSKSNMEEVLNRSKVDFDSRIAKIEEKSKKLLETEISKNMDVFNLNLSSILGDIKDNLKKKVQAIPSNFVLSPTMKTALIIMLSLLLLSPLFMYFNSKLVNKRFDSKFDELARAIAVIDSKPVAKISPDEKLKNTVTKKPIKPTLNIKDNYATTRNRVTLQGKSKFGDFALLSVNGVRKSIRFINNKKFKFDSVELNRGVNKIEIKAYDFNGTESLSETKNIFYKSLPSKLYNLAYNVSRGDIRKPYICLTFDGGSNSLAAPFILDTLRKKRIKTTMFLTGEFIENYPDLTKRIVLDGHEVGNHMFTHPHSIKNHGKANQATLISRENFEIEIKRTARIFEKTTGKKMIPYWRAPYGEINDEVLSWAKSLGYTHVGWTTKAGKSMDSLDWVEMEESKLYRSAEMIKHTILSFDDDIRGGANGSIILMHLGTNRKNDQPYSKLEDIIDGMRNKGYRFAKLTSMMKILKPKRIAKND